MNTQTRPRVLVVDDDLDACANLNDILTDFGCDVTTAHSGESAIELVRASDFDVALLDFKLPGMNGLELFCAIKQESAGTAVLILSAYAAADTAEQALANGVRGVFHKPVDLERLLPLLKAAAERPQLMVVHDDRPTCAQLWNDLNSRGYRVDIARNTAAAAALLSRRRHQIVLVDLTLPDEDALQVHRLVRRLHPATQVLLIADSQSDAQPLVRQMIADGAAAVSCKPLAMPELLNTIDRLSTASEQAT